ncbi:arginine--tRNA ligase [Papillibacter cinnamivorans]|uniref:Arginine--tRNA ligase n=1 Tax=Papillibacter cinnamivorans DSM 12816 TaxID=1122930 RepID=A0A1W2A0C0_9FIRM|nr:arginine--tRNA ligase [Papillibacter cinnamivorans]SMC53902.1 arginyl-tRNA synthetase [Papillibacter cinnamivorans DSM 12816]
MTNMVQAAGDELSNLVGAAYETAVAEGALPAGAAAVGTIEIPKDASHGDYTSGFALAAARQLKLPPRKIAEQILPRLGLEGSYFKSAEVAGAGFINLRLADTWYRQVLSSIEEDGETYGSVDEGRGKKVMVEFVSANPTGTMTIGNARGGVLGDALASILERAGYDVWREFYVNDAGNQVELFARSLEARYLQLFLGDKASGIPENGYHGEDIVTLAGIFRNVYGDRYLKADEAERRQVMMEFGLKYNIEKMRADLERYGITYDEWFRESSLHESGYVEDTIRILVEKGYTYEKDGALWFRVTDFGAEKDEVLRRSTGGYTYFAVDMAYHRNKFQVRGFDRVIDVLGADHHGHALRFKKGITALGIDNSRLEFLIMQLVHLTRDGETVKVSKRTGKAIALSDLLDEISVDAARFWFNSRPNTHLEFDMGLAVRQDSENPVYYVQYAHARICSLISALALEGAEVPASSGIDASLLSTEVEHELIKQLSQLPEEVRLVARELDPSRINRYLIELAARFHRFYTSNRLKGADPEVLSARLKLADSVRAVLENGLKLIGVSAPVKM